MRVLVTGSKGQLATSLIERAAHLRNLDIIAVSRPAFDLMDRQSVINTITDERPDIVISCGAYTAVDRAEDEPDIAYAVNVSGASAVAEATERLGVPIIHVSTDYVFSGDDFGTYGEDAKPSPKNIYGLTKLEGERAVARINPRHVIVRTSWVYSPFGSNFLRTMLKLATQRNEIGVVADQWGSPTSALDLADGLLNIARKLTDDNYGTYHLAGRGATNWADFAKHLLAASKSQGGPYAQVNDIGTADYPAKANRPQNSRLDCTKAAQTFGVRLPDWRTSTETIVARLVRDMVRG